MAFRPLTESECGQANPLSKLTSHVLHDHTFSENHGQLFPNSSDQLVEQFLQESRAIPQTFRMDDLMREMHEIESQRSALPPIPACTVKEQLHEDDWAKQYIDDGKVFHETGQHETVWNEILNEEQNNFNDFDFDGIWPLEEAGPSQVQYSARELRESVDDPKFVYSKFMKFMKNVEDGEVNLEDGKLTAEEVQAWSEEYLKDEAEMKPEVLAQKWADEHTAAGAEDEFTSTFWDKLQENMKKAQSSGEDDDQPWVDEFQKYYNAPQKEYTFSEDNPMFDIDNPLQRGKDFLEEGDFPSAVLCFEAAVKKEPENAEAWLLLGKTQAENEQDPSAIAALNQCLQLDNSNLDALMALAVCYTNESYYNQACNMLFNWLKFNPKYKDLVPPSLIFNGGQQKVIEDLYIKAAQMQPQDVDYEVQSGLGVLFNLSGDYDKAADCFRAAISAKVDDARLWNRLGATLANSSKGEEAVDAYHHALNIAPGFIRARYNVGITCINLNAYKEAAEHFLTALNQQARGREVAKSDTMSQMSETIWSTLRMCISLMNRGDLKGAVDDRDLHTLNKAFEIIN